MNTGRKKKYNRSKGELKKFNFFGKSRNFEFFDMAASRSELEKAKTKAKKKGYYVRTFKEKRGLYSVWIRER